MKPEFLSRIYAEIDELARQAFYQCNPRLSKLVSKRYPNGCTLAECIRFFRLLGLRYYAQDMKFN
jgi:hypothetical protein